MNISKAANAVKRFFNIPEGEKPFSYHDLTNAFQTSKDCPFCDLEAAYMKRYADSLFYENVNNPTLRARLAESGGFCHRHSELLLSMNDALGTAIIYKAQIEALCSKLSKKNTPSISRKTCAEIARDISCSGCPACLAETEDRINRINTFWDWISEDNFKNEFSKSAPVCKEHLRSLLDSARNEKDASALISYQTVKYKVLIAEVEEFIRKNDYRFASEGFGVERDSWIRALRTMNGGKFNF